MLDQLAVDHPEHIEDDISGPAGAFSRWAAPGDSNNQVILGPER
jgi:hypothetical protein